MYDFNLKKSKEGGIIIFSKEHIDYYSNLKEKETLIGENSYLEFIPIEKIEDFNEDYSIKDFLKSHTLFATNGAGTGYTIDDKKNYYEVDLNSLFEEDVISISKNFNDFIKYLEEY